MTLTNQKSSFAHDIHVFRGISIVLIMTCHILYADSSSFFNDFIVAGFSDTTAFFVFIAGYLFQYLLVKFEYKVYLKKKIQYVILPYLIVSIPGILFRIFTGPSFNAEMHWPAISDQNLAVTVVYYLVTGAHLLPLWYIPMIFLFFIAAPAFKFIDDNPKWYWTLIPFFALSFFFYRDRFNNNEILHMAAHFTFYYLLGMFVCKYRPQIDEWVYKLRIPIIIVAIALFIVTLNTDIPYYFQLISVERTINIFLFMILLKNISKEGVLYKYLDLLAKQSFGIYFLHFYILLALRKISAVLFASELPTTPWLWLLMLAATLFISQAVVWVIVKVTGRRSRYLIGS